MVEGVRHPVRLWACALLCACAGAGEREAPHAGARVEGDAAVASDAGVAGGDGPVPSGDAGRLDGGPDAAPIGDGGRGRDAALSPPDAAPRPPDATPPPPDAAPPPPAEACFYPSTDFDGPLVEYDVRGASEERLRFVVPGLPAPERVENAVLSFDGYDLDHPGAEGRIWVNGHGPFDLPAEAGLDNRPSSPTVDVTGATVAGRNVVEFGSSLTEPRTFYRIGRVALTLRARVERCDVAPPPPPPQAVERTVSYRDAEYTRRHNWVIRCNDYAFTARGDEHHETDCDGGYDPDGSRRGTAIFRFDDVVEATYEIVIRSRHTENRNPAGALFVVNGEGRRIDQRTDRGYTEDVWGTRRLSGDVEVVLDSTRENESDSVIWVRLRPVGP